MSFYIHVKYKKTSCPNGCDLFNDTSKFSYWESNKTTQDEQYVVDYLNKNKLSIKKDLLHVGIGNSYVANKLSFYNKIDGVTLSSNEIDYASILNINNYNLYFQNKYAKKNLFNKSLKYYDVIIDVNLKSFSCCDVAFNKLLDNYSKMLNKGGIIITSREGLKWSRMIKPVISFSWNRLFYKRLKEFDGSIKNILNIENCIKLCEKFSLNIDLSNKHLIIFKSNNDNEKDINF